jgi:hypothetical protein
MGLAGARACEGGWLSGPVIHEDSRGHSPPADTVLPRTQSSRGHRWAPADTSWASKSITNEDYRGNQDRVPERGVEPLCPCGQTGLSRPRIPFRHPGLGAANRNTAWLECAP